MKKGDEARMGESLRVNVGRYAGLAGVVVDANGKQLTLHIQGVKDGKPVDVRQVFNEKALGRLI